MKIAFIVKFFPKLSETFILNQILGLIDEGYYVEVFADINLHEEIEHDIINEYSLKEKTTYTNPPKTFFEAVRKTPPVFVNIARQGNSLEAFKLLQYGKRVPRKIFEMKTSIELSKFDVIHFHFGVQAKNFLKRCDIVNAKIITSFYGYDLSKIPNKPGFDGYEEVFRRSDIVTALSQDMANKLQNLGCPKEKIERVPLCVDPEKFQLKEAKNRVKKILTVARFIEKKGLKYAVKALALVEERFEYHIIGDGELREQIEKLVKEEGLGNQVTFHGWMTNEDVRKKMQESDIFLLPSVTASNGDEEGTPTVILEASATELPIVSTRHAGIPEIVVHGETGLLSPERDINQLTSDIEYLIREDEIRKEMGKKGRRYVIENHSIEMVTKKLLALYSQ